ncbi:MAG: aminotransferase class I/II-fold pyridoxal phosphate-dependent enzyme [Thermoanaerobaculia bacterium]
MSADQVNLVLEQHAPALAACLSPLGRRLFYPADIPVQAAEARHTTFNSTIGIFTDGRGGAVPLPSMDAALRLPDADRDRAFLYSPVPGFDELRRRWRDWQRENGPPDAGPSTLPVVTVGLTHGLSILADLFGGEGRTVAVPQPFWGNYRQTFTLRTGAEVASAPAFRGGRYHPEAVAEALAGLAPGRPAIAILNFPGNPGGYSPTVDERRRLRESLLEIADRRPLIAVCDDAYAGLVYEPEIPRHSFFWDIAGIHDQLLAVKVDGATKELSFFGGRVGFLTFGLDLGEEAADALENKLKSLVRSTLGSPVAASQMIVLQALRDGRAHREVAEIRRIAGERYRALKPALEALDPALLRPLPFNAGFFALIELPEELGVTADEVRRHLLANHDTGIVAVGSRYLRLATCSVAAAALPELVARVVRGVEELAGSS